MFFKGKNKMSNDNLTLDEIGDIIDNINIGIYNQLEDDEIALELRSNGNCDAIRFLGTYIWWSEDDKRKYIDEGNSDEREDLEIHLKKIIREKIKLLNLIDWEKI